MTDFPRIINSDIITTDTDIFWLDNEAMLSNTQPKQVLILSLKFAASSGEDEQLKKIIAACKLDETQYNLIQFSEIDEVSWHKLKSACHPKQVILFGCGRCGKGNYRHVFKYLPERGYLQVIGTKIVAPLRYAMRLVYCNKPYINSRQVFVEDMRLYPFRRDV